MSHAPADLKLPQLTTDHPPLFTTRQTCQEWLAGVAITNPTQAQSQLLRQAHLLNHYSLAADERLQILECLRTPIHFVLDECVKRFSKRPLPLAPPEQAAFDTSLALWQALETGYLHCLQACLDKVVSLDETLRKTAALAATRALVTARSLYLDHCSAGMLPMPVYWQSVHKVYLAAEQLQATHLAIEDKLLHNPAVTAVATYVQILLLAATSPLELRTRQMAQVSYWAHRWSAKVPVLTAPPDDLRTPPLCIDLAGNEAAGFTPPPDTGNSLRWLDLTGLRKTIKQRLAGLAQGESPQELKLGKDCTQPGCELLLRQVYEDWCKGGRESGTRIGRTAQSGGNIFQLASGIEAIHYFISGETFHQPEQSVYLSQREHHEIATLGRVATHVEEDKKSEPGYIIEDWQVVDEKISDLRLRRAIGPSGGGGRLTGEQLVAVRAGSTESAGFQLGRVDWIFVAGVREFLIAGIHVLPGAPVAVVLRNPAHGVVKMQYFRGFCLPAIEGLGEVASVLTPEGWFRAGHLIEIRTDAMRQIHLTRLIERGTDFDRCAFEYV